MWADDFDILLAPDQRLMGSSRPLCPSCQYIFNQNTSQQRKFQIDWPDSQVLQDAQKSIKFDLAYHEIIRITLEYSTYFVFQIIFALVGGSLWNFEGLSFEFEIPFIRDAVHSEVFSTY